MAAPAVVFVFAAALVCLSRALRVDGEPNTRLIAGAHGPSNVQTHDELVLSGFPARTLFREIVRNKDGKLYCSDFESHVIQQLGKDASKDARSISTQLWKWVDLRLVEHETGLASDKCSEVGLTEDDFNRAVVMMMVDEFGKIADSEGQPTMGFSSAVTSWALKQTMPLESAASLASLMSERRILNTCGDKHTDDFDMSQVLTDPARGYVSEVHTIGAPATACTPFPNYMTENKCFPGMRAYRQTKGWFSTNYDPVTFLATDTGIGAVPGFKHARMNTLAVRDYEVETAVVHCEANSVETNDIPKASGKTAFLDLGLHMSAGYLEGFEKMHKAKPSTMPQSVYQNAWEHAVFSTKVYANVEHLQSGTKIDVQGNLPYKSQTKVVGQTVCTDDDGNGHYNYQTTVVLLQDPLSKACSLTFKGSEYKAADFLMTDVWRSRYLADWCGFRNVHYGFADQVRWVVNHANYKTQIFPKLSNCSDVKVAGHSLGGAVAELFAACANSPNSEKFHQTDTDSADWKAVSWRKDQARDMDDVNQKGLYNHVIKQDARWRYKDHSWSEYAWSFVPYGDATSWKSFRTADAVTKELSKAAVDRPGVKVVVETSSQLSFFDAKHAMEWLNDAISKTSEHGQGSM
jgi:hypothetical protein